METGAWTGVRPVATIGGGLDRLKADGSGFEHLRHDPADPASLASDRIYYVADDSAGTLWVATADAGIRIDNR